MATALKLYEHREAVNIVTEWLGEAGGELTPEIQALLAEVHADFDTKIERCALYIRKLEALTARRREAATELNALAKQSAKLIENLKAYVKHEMEAADRERVDGLIPVKIQADPPHVESSLSEGELGDLFGKAPRFVRLVPQTFELDKRAILEAHKLNQPLPQGVTVVQDTSLRIG